MSIKARTIEMPPLSIAIQVFKDGKIIYDMPIRPSHSWMRNAYICWINNLGNKTSADATFGEGYWTGKNIGAGLGIPASFEWDGGLAAEASGIVVGTGTDAEDPLNYILTTRIAHGNSAGQLYYTASETLVQSWVTGVVTMSRSRYFNNNSGGSITVNEVGVYSTYLVCRDKLGTGVVVPDTGQLKITYSASCDVSP